MSDRLQSAESLILSGRAILGIEFGSTRIKASLIAPDTTPLASGHHAWENQLVDGIWTYDINDVWAGLASCYASLVRDVRQQHSVDLTKIAALGISGMMHGYIPLDHEDKPLVSFRTWRNNLTHEACKELSSLLSFAVPQRWSIAHLYQSILEGQPHVHKIARLTTLAGYVHLQLTGEHKVGVGEASGMFPVDPTTCDWDKERMAAYDAHVASRGFNWKLADILPRVLSAGRSAGNLTVHGAKLLDPTARLHAGVPLCPPEGDAGTGMVATNSVRPHSGNVSAGTSVFAMIVLEKSLSEMHPEIDIVATPDAMPVAMAHANNGSSDLDAWLSLFGQAVEAMGIYRSPDQLYETLLPLAIQGDPDAGGLLCINYLSGEHVTGVREGRPLFARSPAANFTLPNFIRAMYFASLCALRSGMNVLTEKEGVVIKEIRGHGGFFKGGDTGQRMMAAALNVPVSIPNTAGEGGAWGMAVLAAYMLTSPPRLSLADYLDAHISHRMGSPILPSHRDVIGFSEFFERHQQGLDIERKAIQVLL